MSIKKHELFSIDMVLRVLSLAFLGFALLYRGSNLPLLVIIAALVIFDVYAPQIVNLSKDNPKVKTVRRFNRMSILILTGVFLSTIYNPIEFSLPDNNKGIIVVGIVSITIMVAGNSMPKIPRNRYLGLRLPWTVRDDDTWKIAHKILGYISFPIALLQLALLPVFDYVTIIKYSILTIVLVPSLYSLWFYYRKFKA